MNYRNLICIVTLWTLIVLLFTGIATAESKAVYSDGKIPINGAPITEKKLENDAEDTTLINDKDKVEKALESYTERAGDADLKVDDEVVTSGLMPAVFFEPIGIPFIFHKGLALGYIYSEAFTFNLMYSKAGYDLGLWGFNVAQIDATRILARAQWFPAHETFFLNLGLGQRIIDMTLGAEIMNLANNDNISDQIQIRQNLVNFGIGNLWAINESWILGVDWVDVSYPIGDAKTDAAILDSKAAGKAGSRVRSIFRVLNRVPDISLLRISMGYVF